MYRHICIRTYIYITAFFYFCCDRLWLFGLSVSPAHDSRAPPTRRSGFGCQSPACGAEGGLLLLEVWTPEITPLPPPAAPSLSPSPPPPPPLLSHRRVTSSKSLPLCPHSGCAAFCPVNSATLIFPSASLLPPSLFFSMSQFSLRSPLPYPPSRPPLLLSPQEEFSCD